MVSCGFCNSAEVWTTYIYTYMCLFDKSEPKILVVQSNKSLLVNLVEKQFQDKNFYFVWNAHIHYLNQWNKKGVFEFLCNLSSNVPKLAINN